MKPYLVNVLEQAAVSARSFLRTGDTSHFDNARHSLREGAIMARKDIVDARGSRPEEDAREQAECWARTVTLYFSAIDPERLSQYNAAANAFAEDLNVDFNGKEFATIEALSEHWGLIPRALHESEMEDLRRQLDKARRGLPLLDAVESMRPPAGSGTSLTITTGGKSTTLTAREASASG